MAFPTPVNDQITDAVTQSNVKVLGDAPAQAMSSLYQATALALANAAQNAVAQQQATDVLREALTTRCVLALTSSTARAAK